MQEYGGYRWVQVHGTAGWVPWGGMGVQCRREGAVCEAMWPGDACDPAAVTCWCTAPTGYLAPCCLVLDSSDLQCNPLLQHSQ